MTLIGLATLKLNIFFACTIAPHKFFFFPTWWEYISKTKNDALGQCVPDFSFPHDILSVGLAVLDMLLRLGGFVAVVSIILAGVQYITAQGNAEKAAGARRRLYNSLIGLAIVFVATAAVAFLGNTVGK